MATLNISFNVDGKTHQIHPTHRSLLLKKDIEDANKNKYSSFTLSREIWNLINGEAKRLCTNKAVDMQSVFVTIDTDDGYSISLDKNAINACFDNPISL